jgi:ArsR family transcriptional regulator, arsenate/arsenite/antimonite-responsive transcriptional repressor
VLVRGEDMNILINFFKILSDETRLRILVLLYHKKLCVCELCGIMNESQPKISKHLAKLRDMGFVKDERQEQFIFYRLTVEAEVLKEILDKIVGSIEGYPVLKADVEKSKDAEVYLAACKR